MLEHVLQERLADESYVLPKEGLDDGGKLLADYTQLSAQIKRLTEMRDEVAKEIKEKLDDGEIVRIPGAYQARYIVSNRSTFDHKGALKAGHISQKNYEKWLKTTESKSLNIERLER